MQISCGNDSQKQKSRQTKFADGFIIFLNHSPFSGRDCGHDYGRGRDDAGDSVH